MGTMIQSYGLGEQDYRGDRFADWTRDLRGNNDLLSLTQPAIIRAIHAAYLEAGADILETNSFNSTAISMADYGMEDLVYELNHASARIARDVADEFERRAPRRPALRGRGAGADQPDRFAVTRRERSRFSERALRRAGGGLRRGDSGTAGRWRRPPAGRDHLRHAQCQGRAVRHRRALRGHRDSGSDHDLGHDHRRQRPHPLGPDHRSVLELGGPRPAAHGGAQLRARRQGAAAVRPGAVPGIAHAS